MALRRRLDIYLGMYASATELDQLHGITEG